MWGYSGKQPIIGLKRSSVTSSLWALQSCCCFSILIWAAIIKLQLTVRVPASHSPFLIRCDGDSQKKKISRPNLYLSHLCGERQVLTLAAELQPWCDSLTQLMWADPFQFLFSYPKNLHPYHQQHKADPLWSSHNRVRSHMAKLFR